MLPLPSVSVIVPAYNASDIIDRCIEALLKLNYQKNKLEIIIVDNNSSDETLKIIEKYPVILETENKIQSSYAARNKGLLRATGEIIAFTDSDCIVDPEWINIGVRCFSDETCGAVAGEILSLPPNSIFEEYLETIKFLHQKHCLNNPFLPYMQTANAFYRRSILDEIGFFDADMISGGDADLAWRMQILTDYKLLYSSKSKILHRHRNTLKGLYNQKKTHGIGKAHLEKKHYDLMFKKNNLIYRKNTNLLFLNKLILHTGYIFYKLFLEIIHGRPRRAFDGFFTFTSFWGECTGQKIAKKRFEVDS